MEHIAIYGLPPRPGVRAAVTTEQAQRAERAECVEQAIRVERAKRRLRADAQYIIDVIDRALAAPTYSARSGQATWQVEHAAARGRIIGIR